MRFRSISIQQLLAEHVELVLTSLSSLEEMLTSLRVYDINKSLEINKLIYEYEKHADAVHRKNVEKICKGSIFGYLREDILRLMDVIDNIADLAKEASTTLTIRMVQKDLIIEFLNDDLMDYVRKSIMAAKELANLINMLDKKRDKIIEYTRIIEEYEEASDNLKNLVFKRLYNNSAKYDVLTILQFKEFVYLIDAIADNSEDASDIILIMIAKGYS